MTLRRFVAGVAALLAVLLLAVSVLATVRVRDLDGQASALALTWARNQGDDTLLEESNRRFEQARAIEDGLPLGPVGLLGLGVLAGAVAVGTWPPERSRERPN